MLFYRDLGNYLRQVDKSNVCNCCTDLTILGIDLNSMMNLAPKLAEENDLARKAQILYPMIVSYQDALSSLEKCRKPVLSAIHNACIGAGVDLITAADVRYCTKDAFFEVKEVFYDKNR